MQIRDQILMYW